MVGPCADCFVDRGLDCHCSLHRRLCTDPDAELGLAESRCHYGVRFLAVRLDLYWRSKPGQDVCERYNKRKLKTAYVGVVKTT